MGHSVPIYINIIAFLCTAGAIALAILHIYKHLLNYTEPTYQRYIVRIVFMVPVWFLCVLYLWYFCDRQCIGLCVWNGNSCDVAQWNICKCTLSCNVSVESRVVSLLITNRNKNNQILKASYPWEIRYESTGTYINSVGWKITIGLCVEKELIIC